MRVLRRITHAAIVALLMVVITATAVVLVSQTEWFRNRLRAYVVRQAGQYLNGAVTIDRLRGNLFSGLELDNVSISIEGREVMAIDALSLDYDILEIISSGLSVDAIRLNKPAITLWRHGGTWSIRRLLKNQEQKADREGPGRPISIREIVIADGSLSFDEPAGGSGVVVPRRFDGVNATLAFDYEPVRYSLEVTHAAFRGAEPSFELNELSGGISVRDDTIDLDTVVLRTAETSLSIDGAIHNYLADPALDLELHSNQVSLPELAQIVPALDGVDLRPGFALALGGPLDRLRLDIDIRSTAGELRGNFVTDVASPGQAATGAFSVRGLDLAPLVQGAERTRIAADVRVDVRAASLSDLRSVGGTISIEAPRIVAGDLVVDRLSAQARIDSLQVAVTGRASGFGGAAATTRGTIVLQDDGRPASFDLRGQARHLDVARLPGRLDVARPSTDLNVDYHVSGSTRAGAVMRGNLALVFAPSTAAGASIGDGSVVRVTLDGDDVRYEADAVIAALNLQDVGRELNIPSLQDDRYVTSINGHVQAHGRGTALHELELAATGLLRNTLVVGGTVSEMSFDASVGDDTASVKAAGSFVDLDPAMVGGRAALKGSLDGSVDVAVVVENVSKGITPEQIRGTARATLARSSVAELVIDSATLDGDYRSGAADVRAFELVGPDVTLRISGLLAINDSDESNLQVHADTPNLEKLAALVVEPAVAVIGIGSLDAIVTGNRRALQAMGSFHGSGLRHGSSGALTVSSDFVMSVPDLDVRVATGSATTRGTFVTLAGQSINQLDAKTDYDGQQVVFEATGSQPERTIEAAGALVLHPEHQEVHLQRLSFTSQGVMWRTAPDAEATISYASDSVTVDDFALVNGPQRIEASGSLGSAGDALNVTFRDVEVATIDALLLRPPQFVGLLNATATVSGPKDAPEVQADFSIDRGAFRQFQYDSFSGTVDYTPRVVTLETRLQPNPSAWIETKGQVPTSLLNGTASIEDDQPIDLRIDSTPIDMAILQGLTTALTNVTGTFETHVHLTGSAADPRPDGVITIDSAAFELAANGVAYSDLDGRIALLPDRIRIEEMRVLDNRQSSLTLTGELAIRERTVGEMAVGVSATDFKVIDNEMGNVRLNAELQLTGQVNAPRLEGQIGVTTGDINLDPILELLGNRAYATTQTEFVTPDVDVSAAGAPPRTSALEPLQIDVRFTVPNDLVVQAADWRTPGSPVSLGDLNLTLGGDLYIHQVPYDRVRLYGVVNTVRGTYAFQGRQFTILRDGALRFDGLDEFNPALDVRAERVIQGVTAQINVRGNFSRPELVLTSVPPLEQADVLALIIFNQPINQLGTGEQLTLAERAQALATGAVASQLASSIGDALGVDAFEISTAPDSGAAAEVTIGQQIGQNLYVRLQQGIGDQAQTNFILEYELAEWLRLQANVVEGSPAQQQVFRRAEGSGFNLLFFFSY